MEIGIGVASCEKLGASEFLCTECLSLQSCCGSVRL